MREKWYKIPGYSDYMITKSGKVKSLKLQEAKILKTYKDNHGHIRIDITDDNGKRGTTKLHRLLAITFIPNPDNLPVVRHLNDIKDDNRLENLAWGTQKDNINDGWTNGVFDSHYKPLWLIKGDEKIPIKTLKEASEYLNVTLGAVKNARYKNRTIKGYKIIERSNSMFTNDEYEAMLRAELENMKKEGKIRRYDVTYKAFTGKFDIWLEWADYHASNICGVITVEDLKKEISTMLPVKKSFKCYLCRFYIPKCDGCKKGYFNSIFIPCPDFKSKELEPTDKETSKSLKSIIKETANMVGPDAEAHKLADELMCYILEAKGYEKGVRIFKKLEKGFEGISDECEYLAYNDIIQWQCIMCRYAKQIEGGCRDGLDEGWFMNNECPHFSHQEKAITPREFEMYMQMLLEEKDCLEDYDVRLDEELHYNMDKLMMYVVRSLGYTKTADIYETMNKHYLQVPF